MEDVDTLEQTEYDDEAMFLSDVIQEEHELLFLDSYLREALRTGVARGTGHPTGEGVFSEEPSL